jgi:penicillin-binding protein 1B
LKVRLRIQRLRTRLHTKPGWVRAFVYTAGLAAVVSVFTLAYYYVSFSRLIDARLHGERERTLPRVYARPVELRRGQSLSAQDLVGRLNDLGYAQRSRADVPGEFAVDRGIVSILPRSDQFEGRPIQVRFPARAPRGIQSIEITGRGRTNSVQLDSPLLTALMTSGGR